MIGFTIGRREQWGAVRTAGILAAGLACTALLAAGAGADVGPLGGEIQVNSYTLGLQANPSVGATAGGEFVVVWRSRDSNGVDDDSYSVQGQRFASNGTAVGGEFTVNSYTADEQTYPMVAVRPGGDFVVVWQS